MKKIFLIIALFIIPTCVFAADLPKVTKLDAILSNKEIKYNGEVEDGSYAVMCKLLSDEEEIDLLSSPVSDNKFDGSFTVSDNGDYEIACANYEGGEIKKVSVTTDDKTKEEETKEEVKDEVKEANPKTGDNIVTYVTLGILSLIGLTLAYLFKKRLD